MNAVTSLYELIAGDPAITVVRLTVLASSGWMVAIMRRILRRRRSENQSIALIPKAVLWFTLLWNAATFLIVAGLLVVGTSDVTGLLLVWYGLCWSWSLFGAAWVLHEGTQQSLSAVEAMEQLKRIAEQEVEDAA